LRTSEEAVYSGNSCTLYTATWYTDGACGEYGVVSTSPCAPPETTSPPATSGEPVSGGY
jgi:hypothetical protein